MADMLWPQTDTRAVVEPEPTSLRLFHGNLQPLTTPQAFDPLVVQMPSRIPQHGGDPTIAVAPILTGQFDHIPHQQFFVVAGLCNVAVRRSVLLQDLAGTTFRDVVFAPHQINAAAAPCGAQKFPLAASAKISLSNVRSDTARRRRSFSRCSRFNSFS